MSSWPDQVTPRDLARALGRSPKTIRQWLRDNPPCPHVPHERWVLTPAEADRVVRSLKTRQL